LHQLKIDYDWHVVQTKLVRICVYSRKVQYVSESPLGML